jgi:hypothetical protein
VVDAIFQEQPACQIVSAHRADRRSQISCSSTFRRGPDPAGNEVADRDEEFNPELKSSTGKIQPRFDTGIASASINEERFSGRDGTV